MKHCYHPNVYRLIAPGCDTLSIAIGKNVQFGSLLECGAISLGKGAERRVVRSPSAFARAARAAFGLAGAGDAWKSVHYQASPPRYPSRSPPTPLPPPPNSPME